MFTYITLGFAVTGFMFLANYEKHKQRKYSPYQLVFMFGFTWFFWPGFLLLYLLLEEKYGKVL